MQANLVGENSDSVLMISNLDQKVTEELVWELLVQVSIVWAVYFPRDKITGEHQGYGFVELRSQIDVQYAINVLKDVWLFGRRIKLSFAQQKKQQQEIGAKVFISNLHQEVDETLLRNSF